MKLLKWVNFFVLAFYYLAIDLVPVDGGKGDLILFEAVFEFLDGDGAV